MRAPVDGGSGCAKTLLNAAADCPILQPVTRAASHPRLQELKPSREDFSRNTGVLWQKCSGSEHVDKEENMSDETIRTDDGVEAHGFQRVRPEGQPGGAREQPEAHDAAADVEAHCIPDGPAGGPARGPAGGAAPSK